MESNFIFDYISDFWPLLVTYMIVALVYFFCYRFYVWACFSSKRTERNTYLGYIARILRCLLLVIMAILSLLFVSTTLNWCLDTVTTPSTPTIEELSERIDRISKELSASSKELLEIQTELESRIEAVEALKKEAKIAEDTIDLTSEQVDAIRAQLSQELAASSGQNTVVSVIVNTVFFFLGIIVPLIIRFVKNKWLKQQQPPRTETESGYSKDEIERAIELLKTIERTGEFKK